MRHTITQALLDWHASYGRHDLPWQNTRDMYRIWVSEIMLQQTQVATVIPYYERFMERFPTVSELAKTDIDEVLHLWTGLGYYARGRNLHKAARIVAFEYDGVFPTDHKALVALPGIGRSTAGAMLAFAEHQRHAILDGNVKRVLARFYEVEGWYGKKSVENTLWDLAEQNTPTQQVHTYTQAIMDFGATLCSRSKPKCHVCPLSEDCRSLESGRVSELPHGKPKTTKPSKHTYMLLIKNEHGEFLLKQNPPTGIWGGLWCPPQVVELENTITLDHLTIEITSKQATFKHTFSHFHLDITPVDAKIVNQREMISDANHQWYQPSSDTKLGLAAPVKKLLLRQ